MNRFIPQGHSNTRVFGACLLSFLTLIGPMASVGAAIRRVTTPVGVARPSVESINRTIAPQPLTPLAPVLSASLTDNTLLTVKKNPGDTINYTATITNGGAASPADDALAMIFNAPLDSNTTLVGGSIHASPIAFNDSYNWVGNTVLDTNARSLPSITANDVALTDAITLNTTPASGPANGSVTISSNGHFVYTPNVGFTGTDSFTYTISNSVDGTLVSTGTVSINMPVRVWYLVAGGSGDGRSHTPSGSPSAISTSATLASDILYVYFNAANLNGAFTLDNSQTLTGEGVALVANSITLRPAGSKPTITNTTGNAVTLASSNLVTGLNISQANNFAIAGNAVGGTTNVTGVGITNSSTGGGLTLTTQSGTLNFTNSPISGTTSGTAVLVSGGTGAINFSNSPVSRTTGRLLDIQSKTGGSVLFNGGSTVTGTAITTDAIVLRNHTGGTSLTFSNNVNVTTSNGRGIQADNSTSSFVLIMNAAANTISATGGAALDIEDLAATSNLVFTSVSSTNSSIAPAHGLRINNTNGSFTFGNTSFSGSNSTGVLLTSNASTLTFADLDITPDSGQRGLHATSNSGTITSTSGTISTTNQTAVEIVGTSAASRTPLNVQLTSVSALASGGNPANGIIITNTSATGSPGGFRILGSGGTCNEATPTCTGGHIQNTTGADVDPVASSPTGTGIVLRNADTISLTRIRINGNQNYGIHGLNVNSFTLDTSVVHNVNGTNVASPFRDSSIRFDQLTGTNSITNSLITGGFQHNLLIDNQSGTSQVTVSNNVIKNTSAAVGDDGFQLEAELTAVVNAFVTNNSFSVHGGDHFNLSMINSADVDLTFTGNAFAGGHAVGLGQGMLVFGASFNGTLNYDISNNGTAAVPLTGNKQGGMIHVNKGSGTATFNGRIQNNFIGNAAINKSASEQASGIVIGTRGAGGSHTTLIDGNTIRQYFDMGIVSQTGEGGAALNATITNNTVSDFADAINSLNGIHSDNGISLPDTNSICMDIRANSVATAGNEPQGGADIRLRKGPQVGLTLRIPGLVGTTATDADNKVTADNPTATTVNVTGSGYAGGAACTQPTLPAAPLAMLTSSMDQRGQLALVNKSTKVTDQPNSLSVNKILLLASAGVSGRAIKSTASLDKTTSRGEVKFAHARVNREHAKNATAHSSFAPLAGETVNVGGVSGFTLPAGKTVAIKYAATISTTPTAASVSTKGTITPGPGGNFIAFETNDPETAGGPLNDPTVTNLNLPDLTVVKSHVGDFKQGDTGKTYTITVTNSGTFATFAGNTVSVSDTVPTGLTATAINGTNWNCTQPAGPCTRTDSLASLASYEPITLTVNVANNAAASVTNTAVIANGSGGEVNNANNSDDDQTNVIQVPDLTIDKSHSGSFSQGQTGATYTISVSNAGPGPVLANETITVTDTLPTGLTATAISGTNWNCTQPAGPCTRTGANSALAVAASYPAITLTVNVAANANVGNPGVTNSASVSGGGELNTANNSDSDPTAVNAGADLTIDKSHTDIFTQGDTGKTYTITVTNSGGTASSGNVTVTDTLPTGLTPTAPNGAHNGWTCSIVGQDLTCTRSDALNPAASYPNITLTVDVSGTAPPSVDNTATVAGGGDVNGTNNSDTDQTTINQLCLTPPGGMVAWWTGDDTERDIAGGNDGTLNGNAGYAAGKVLNGFNLDGTGDFVEAPDANSLDLTTAITIDAWINPTNANATARLVDKSTTGGTDGYLLELNAGKLRFIGGSATAESLGTVPNGVLTHVAVTYDGANVSFYLNGVLDSTTPLTGAIPVNALPLRIGAAQDGSLGFTGVIDEVEIFSTALPVADILAIHNAGAGGKCKPSDLRITKTHSGNFFLNQTGATYSIAVTNDGPGTTTGTVSVTDTLPAGLTATGFTGTNWSCQPLPVLSCSRSDALASGGSYENIILTVNVDSGAPTGPNAVTNTASVTGGGGLDTSDDTANDPTQINNLPDNIAPVNTVPGAQVTNEDVAIVFTGGTQISIADADAGSNPVQVSLTATNGVISLSTTTGLDFACVGCSGDGTNDASIVFQGTITDINTALNNLTFTPTANYSGPASLQIVTDDLGNSGFGGSQSDTDTINITVNSVNDPPSFTIAGNPPAVNEDAGAQTVNGFASGISSGPGESQTLTFNVTPNGTTGNIAFSSGPSIDSTTGNLTYTASPDTNGTATFDVTLSDNGGGTDTSSAQSFTITVNAVNDTPSFQIASNPAAVNEDAGLQTVNSFATNFQPGPVTATDEASQTLVGYTVTQTSSTGSLTFTSGPSISNVGTLTYTSSADTFGTATFDVVATDSGSGTSPNVNQSAAVAFTVTVNGVNDPPSFTIAGDPPAIAINSGAQTVNSFATNISQGPGETGQTLTFNLSPAGTTGTIAFTSGPSIDATTGNLTYTPTAGTSGTATFDVTLSDDGGGTDTSAAQQFTITVVPQLNLTVNETGDASDLALDGVCDTDAAAGSQCTLRAAIQETNNAASADTIGFSLPADSTIELTGALPAIAGDLELNGPANGLTIDGNNSGRVFSVSSGTVTIDPLTITGGLVNGGHGAGLLVTGGDVTVKDLLFTGNKVVNGNGGAIAVTGGLLAILNSTVSGNTATNGGGVHNGGGGLTLVNVTVTSNTADGDTGSGPTATGDGGGLQVGANPTVVRNSIIAGNTATTNPDVSGTIGLGGNNLTSGDARLAPLADNGGPTMTHALLAGSPALDAGNDAHATGAGLSNDQRGAGFTRIADGPDGDATATVDIGAFEAQVWVEDIGDRSIDEDGSDSFSINVGGAAAVTTVTATSSNPALVPNSLANLEVTGAGGTRTLTITPVVNGFGSTTITVTVASASGTMSDTFVFTVNPVNDPPVFTGGPDVVVNEDAGAQTVPNWATGISPGPANESTQTLTFLVSNGNPGLFSVQPAIAANGTLTFTPAANASGVSTVSVQLQDNGGGTDTSPFPPDTFTITVNAVNDAPTANGQSVNTNEDTPLGITLTGTDTETPSGSLSFTITDQPDHGVLSGTGANRTYTPNANYNGPDSFKFTVTDTGDGLSPALTSAEATVSITVDAVNDGPTANGQSVNTNEDTPLGITLTGSDLETAAANLIFNVTVQPANGVLSGTGANLSYTPNANFNGADSFKFTVTDTGDGSSPALTSVEVTVSITVDAVNDAPVNSVPGAQTVNQNGSLTFTAANTNLISISDPDAGSSSVQVTLTATNGTLTLGSTAGLTFVPANAGNDGVNDATLNFTGTIANLNAALSGLVFTPTSGFNGAASLQLVTNDQGNTGSGGALSDTDTINITVASGGTIQFSSATYTVTEGGGNAVITITRSGGSAGTATVDVQTSNGTADAGDYTTVSQTVTFVDGDTSETVNVPITNDGVDEPDETVNLTLSNAGGSGTLGTPSTAVLTIQSDDSPTFSFALGSYSVGEGGASVTITVNRAGDPAAAVTVDYSTNDFMAALCSTANGNASAKCDYATSGGRLRFAAGETSKTIVLSIVDDTYVEGDETLSLALADPVGGALGSPSTTVVTIQDNDTNPNAANPFPQNPFFVRQQYLDFLLREPDTAGFNDWLNVLNNCQPNQGFLGSDPACDRVHVSSGFFRSTEFGERGYWVYRFFEGSLGRRPTFEEFTPEMKRLSGLKPQAELDLDEADFIAEFMQLPEFTNKYSGLTTAANAAQFIAALEQTAGVTLPATVPPTQPGQPTQYGRQELINLMAAGTLTPAQTLRAFIEQKVVWDKNFFKAFVAMQYFGYLRRNPDNAGYDDWLDVLTNGRPAQGIPPGDFRHLVFGFVYSVEYRQRFGQP